MTDGYVHCACRAIHLVTEATCPNCGAANEALPVPETPPHCRMSDREIFARLLASALVGNGADLAGYRAREAMRELDALYPARGEKL